MVAFVRTLAAKASAQDELSREMNCIGESHFERKKRNSISEASNSKAELHWRVAFRKHVG